MFQKKILFQIKKLHWELEIEIERSSKRKKLLEDKIKHVYSRKARRNHQTIIYEKKTIVKKIKLLL